MTTEANKETVRRFYEAMNRHDSVGAASLWADETVNHGRKVDHNSLEKLLGEIVQIHDHSEALEMIAEGDWVVCRVVVSGTHRITPTIPFDGGIYNVTKPEGRKFTSQHIHMFRMEGGKIKEHWANRDDLGAAKQMGMELRP